MANETNKLAVFDRVTDGVIRIFSSISDAEDFVDCLNKEHGIKRYAVFVRAPCYDLRTANGDYFSGDAWSDTEMACIRWIAVNYAI